MWPVDELVGAMADNLTPEQRRRAMSNVRHFDTAPELVLRSALHRLGLRFRTHARDLPGRPDIVFRRSRVAVFVDGAFWHGFRFPAWRDKLSPYWQAKIQRNRVRDRHNFRKLRRLGWTVVRVWDHQINRDLDGCVRRVSGAVVGP